MANVAYSDRLQNGTEQVRRYLAKSKNHPAAKYLILICRLILQIVLVKEFNIKKIHTKSLDVIIVKLLSKNTHVDLKQIILRCKSKFHLSLLLLFYN